MVGAIPVRAVSFDGGVTREIFVWSVVAMVDQMWCLCEVDIFRDLANRELAAIAGAARKRVFPAGELLHAPQRPIEVLYILKIGRVRLFRLSVDGRALTTGIVSPGTIFGERALLGHCMYDSFAQALDEVVVCEINQADARRLLLSDARIAARIAEILGQRLLSMERRLTDAVFKSVRQRVARALATVAREQRLYVVGSRALVVPLTHEEVAALVGTSRETATKVLGDLADQGLIRLGRGRIVILNVTALRTAADA
jgi:CRP/FNR family transcriptional regulator, cyclic AMP receptor protein